MTTPSTPSPPAAPRPVPDPCINICRMDAARRYCQGCGRTSTEIGLWHGMTDAQRAFVLAALPERRRRTP